MPWIEKCLSSVPEGYPVIVIDNASTDETISYIESSFGEVTLLPQKENLGFGKANNIGLAYALEERCSGVFLLNQDAYLFPDTIATLEKISQEHQDYGILSPLHFAGDNYHLDRNFKDHLLQSNSGDFLSDSYQQEIKEIYDARFVNAAAWFLPRKTVESIGGFDPIFAHYGEDDNYCQRVRYHNLKIGVCSKATIIHDRNQELRQIAQDYSDTHYAYMERLYKIRLADINNELTNNKLNGLYNRKKKDLLKARLRFNFLWISRRKKELALIKRIMPMIHASRGQNSVIGAHYISSTQTNS
tara:strand:+ start:49780 stop:50682 length:903 start_codon:yes stop_codon:yes gene_type:complete